MNRDAETRDGDVERAARSVASYIPLKLSREITALRRQPPRRRELLRGPVMFVDLAGFTPFVLSFCAAGQKGIETLQNILTDYFGKLVEEIYAYGGDVFHFAGDAMLVGFTSEPAETDAESIVRAVACATHLRASLADYEDLDILGQRHRMQLKFGLGFGSYHYLLLGHEDFWYTPLLLGRPVQSAIDAEHHAEAGDILVDRSIWDGLPSPKSGSPVNGFVKLESGLASDSVTMTSQPFPGIDLDREFLRDLARFVEPVLFQKATTSHSDYAGDFREVTCLFVRFTEIPGEGDVEATLTRLNEIYRFVQESAKAYGAILNRVELGDKGFVFFFMLGAPSALEHKCTLAGRLALKLSQPPFSMDHAPQIGVATGYGYCGDIGAAQRRDYTVTGDVVNLAARLMTYADAGGIYVDATTRDRFDERLLTTGIPNVRLKGLPEPVTIFTLHAEAARHQGALLHFPDQMIGRADELSRLLNLFDESRRGSVRVCGVVGEAGLGKSRLLRAFLDRLPEGETTVCVSVCYSHDQFAPYGAWKELLSEFLGVARRHGVEQTCGRIAAQIRRLQGVSEEWSAVLAQIIGISAEEAPFTRDLDPRQKNRRIFQIVHQLVELRSADEPVVLCFDDAHWMDDVSLRLVEYLSQHLHSESVLILLASRTGELLRTLQGHPHFELLPLKRLPADASLALLRGKLPLRARDSELEDQILERADGNPFFIESIVRNLGEQGVFSTSAAGKLKLPFGELKIHIPESLQDLVLTRIDRLSEDEKTVLRIAAVVGRTFDYELLKTLIPETLRVTSLGDILTRLEALDLVPVASNSPLTYYFKHAVIRDVAYDTLPLERREVLHRRIGDQIEAGAGDSVQEQADLLAYHFVSGNEPEKGLSYSIAAGRAAAEKFANQDAQYHFKNALQILGRDAYEDRADERLIVREQLGHVYRQAGMYAEAIDLFTQCLDRLSSPVRRAEIHIGLGSVYQEEGQAARAIDELESALRLLDRKVPRGNLAVVASILWELLLRVVGLALPFPPRRVEGETRLRYQKQFDVMNLLGKTYFFVELKKTAWTVINLVKVAERLQTPEELSLAYGNYAVALMGQGLVERASTYCSKSLELAKNTDNPSVLGQVYMRAGSLGIYSNDPLQSQRAYEKGVQIFKQIGGMWEQLTGLGAMTAAYTLASDFAKTDELFAELEELAGELDSKMHLGWAKCWRPFYRYLLGRDDAERARREIRASIPYSTECNDTGTRILAHGHLCAIAVREGDAAAAALLADETHAALWRHKANLPIRTPQMAWVYAAEAGLFALRHGAGSVPQRRLHTVVKRGVKRALRLGRHYPYVLGPGLRVHACYQALRKGPSRSSRQFEHAFRVLEEGPDRWQTGLAYYEAMSIFPQRADELAGKARTIFEALGLSAELRRLEARSASTSKTADVDATHGAPGRR